MKFSRRHVLGGIASSLISTPALAGSHGRQNDLNLVAMGDSLTAERSALGGATMSQTYPALIAKARGYANVWNAGLSGNTTTQMLARFASDVLAHHPGAISIMGFTNDQTTNVSGVYPTATWNGAGMTVATTKANLKSMVQQAQAQRCRVTLLSPPPQRYEPYLSHSAVYLTALTQIASETGCEYMDIYSRINALSAAQQDALYISTDLLGHWSAVGHAFAAAMAAEVGNATCFAQV